jgi:bacteriorhodopsin
VLVFELPDLTTVQFFLVDNALSLTFAVFLGTALYCFVTRSDVAPAYRSAVTVSGVILTIAGYHYLQMLRSFEKAYEVTGAGFMATGEVFNEAYRYADWVVTVPLLMVELILVLSVSAERRASLLKRLVPAAFAMIALGYPGELTTVAAQQWLWWALAMVPFVYILYVLFGELSTQIAVEPEAARGKLRTLRLLLLVSWMFYPVAYLFPILLGNTGSALVLENVGYAVADITAKAGYGLLIVAIAKSKSKLEAAPLAPLQPTEPAAA